MRSSLICLVLFFLFVFVKKDQLLDNGQSLFFPTQTYAKISAFSSFKITNWNNIILNDEKAAIAICTKLRKEYKDRIDKIMCQTEFSEHIPLVSSYLKDQFIIYPAPNVPELNASAQKELSKLTLLMGPESEQIMSMMRHDPMGYKEFLLSKVQVFMNKDYSWKNGLLKNVVNGIFVIPIQFSYPPSEIEKTEEIMNLVRGQGGSMIGQYEGFYSNRTAIEKDLNEVGWVSAVMFALFFAFIIYLKLFKLIKLIVPTALGIAVSFFVTWIIYGKVHGITVAFGTGIIGLAIDYGFHFVFSKDKASAWKSNLFALLTTLAVFAVFLFSSVPLIRQMMIFSIVGLVASYVFSRLLLIRDHIDVNAQIHFKKSKWHVLSLPFVLLGIFYFINLKVDTSVERFNFLPSDVKETQKLFFSSLKKEKIFFKIYDKNDLDQAQTDYAVVEGAGVRSESIFSYLPDSEQRKKNLNSWITLRNSGFKFKDNSAKLFKPFEEELQALDVAKDIDLDHPPAYIEHLVNQKVFLTMWFVKDKESEGLIRNHVSGAESLIDIVVGFAESLSQEVTLFMPITILAILILLYFKYSNFKKSFVCLIPFLFTLGLYGMLYKFLNLPLGFMSLLGMFLIYGFSVDYGIFSTDFFVNSKKEQSEESALNLSLIVNWVSAFIGFLPMVWCDHPILHDLGVVLITGMFGIFYSTFFVIPGIFVWVKRA